MFVKGSYSGAEQRMLDEFRTRAAQLHGWAGEAEGKTHFKTPLNLPEADRDIFRIIARNNDAKNPLYYDEQYAQQSRWGRVVAPPMFLLNVSQGAYLKLEIPAEVGTVLSCDTGADYTWSEQVYEGDRLHVYCESPRVEDETPAGEQPQRVLAVYYTNRYYNQHQLLVGTISHYEKWTYAQPGAERENMLTIGYEKCSGISKTFSPIRTTPDYAYTPEQAEMIQNFYEAEERRGDRMRCWEDVKNGEKLPSAVFGPLTEWDAVSAIGPSAEKTLTMMEIRRRYPEKLIYDKYGVPHHKDEIYISKAVPLIEGRYSSTASEQTLAGLMLRLVNNWMGDDGFVSSFSWRQMTNACLGDTIIANGQVTRTYVDDGIGKADIDIYVDNFRGFLSAVGTATVCLPTRTAPAQTVDRTTAEENIKTERSFLSTLFGRGRTSKMAQTAVPPVSTTENMPFRVKDCVQICEDAAWAFGGGHPLAGKRAQVAELVPGWNKYVYCLLDEDCVGLDTRAVLGFRADMLKKI